MSKIKTIDLLTSPGTVPLARKRLSADEYEQVKFVSKELGIDPDHAKQILFTDQARADFLKYKRSALDVGLTEVVEILQKAVKKAAKKGKLSDARFGAVATAVLRDKLFSSQVETKNAIAVTKGLTINMNWKFNPYGKKQETIEDKKEIQEITEIEVEELKEDNKANQLIKNN